MTPLTYLFVPDNRLERFAKALTSHADLVTMDLEDVVSPQDKASVRASIGSWLVSDEPANCHWYTDDFTWLQRKRLTELMLCKSKINERVAVALRHSPTGACLLPLMETVRGLHSAVNIAQVPSFSTGFWLDRIPTRSRCRRPQQRTGTRGFGLDHGISSCRFTRSGVWCDPRFLPFVLAAVAERALALGMCIKLCNNP